MIRTLLTLSLICSPLCASAATNELGWTLDSALKQLGRQAKDFETALADVNGTWTSDDGEELRSFSGRVYVNGDGLVRLDVDNPAEQVVLVESRRVYVYDPVRALVEAFPLRKHRERWEPFVREGFAHTGRDLRDDFVVTLIGEDQVGDRRVLGVELTPKDDRQRAIVSSLQVWIDQASWMPASMIINLVASGERLTLAYSGMARNLPLNPDLFRDRWPRGTQSIDR